MHPTITKTMLNHSEATDVIRDVQTALETLEKHQSKLMGYSRMTPIVSLKLLLYQLKQDFLNPTEGDIDDEAEDKKEYLRNKDDE